MVGDYTVIGCVVGWDATNSDSSQSISVFKVDTSLISEFPNC